MPADNLISGLALSGSTANHLMLNSGTKEKQMESIIDPTSQKEAARSQLDDLGPEWKQRAAEELNEKPNSVADDIETFRNMLQRYYVMKLRCPELFRVPRPSEKSHILEMQVQNMLDERDSFGRRVYIFRVVSIEDIFRTNVLALEHVVQEPETQIAGLTVIVDMNGFGLQHAKFLSPYYARRTVEVIQIYLHGRDITSLHAFIKPEILPAEYGGQQPSFDNKKWRLALLAKEDEFVELETYGYKIDETPDLGNTTPQ
ncbi:Uncharacterized protein GBIM_19984 [Gryllus bimaculatus]|nr:Uncharacterized protein GBIM_19984 [Gryllus bimaculatus]